MEERSGRGTLAAPGGLRSEEVAGSTQGLHPAVNTGSISSEGDHLGVRKGPGHARLVEKGVLWLLAGSVKGKLV